MAAQEIKIKQGRAEQTPRVEFRVELEDGKQAGGSTLNAPEEEEISPGEAGRP